MDKKFLICVSVVILLILSGMTIIAKGFVSASTVKEQSLEVTPRNPTPYFFKGGDVRVHGQFKGYTPTLGFDAFNIMVDNVVTNERKIEFMQLDSLGNFDKTFHIPAPTSGLFWIRSGEHFSAYLEPGNDLEIILDYTDAPDSVDESCAVKNYIQKEFGGSLADINRILYNAPEEEVLYIRQLADNTPPAEAKQKISELSVARKEALRKYADEINADAFTRKFLETMAVAEVATWLLDYEFERDMNMEELPDSLYLKEMPTLDYYRDFIPELFAADTLILAVNSSEILLNRLQSTALPFIAGVRGQHRRFFLDETAVNEVIKKFAGTDSIPFLWEVARANAKCPSIKATANLEESRPFARNLLDKLYSNTVKDASLRNILEKYFADVSGSDAYELPNNPEGNLMREILKPYAGKCVIVDFWSTGCGPCRAEIENGKEFRDLNRDNDKFTYLFITGAEESPLKYYNEYVEKNLQGEHSLRIDAKDMAKLKSLFNIGSIPHSVFIDSKGRVASNGRPLVTQLLDKEKIEYKVVEVSKEDLEKRGIKIEKVEN